jgi:hypothetical protein
MIAAGDVGGKIAEAANSFGTGERIMSVVATRR